MEHSKKCMVCGSYMVFKREGSTQGWYCKNCEWNEVTTFIKEIELDRQTYKVYLIEGDEKDINQIRVLSKVNNNGFLKSKSILKVKGSLLYCGMAKDVYNICETFDDVGIKYYIEPKFQYREE